MPSPNGCERDYLHDMIGGIKELDSPLQPLPFNLHSFHPSARLVIRASTRPDSLSSPHLLPLSFSQPTVFRSSVSSFPSLSPFLLLLSRPGVVRLPKLTKHSLSFPINDQLLKEDLLISQALTEKMFSKSLLALSVLALSSFTYAAPALSCPAASTVTVNAAASSSSSVAAVTTSSVAKASSVAATTAAAATTSAASKSGSGGNNNVASTPSFGRCSTPQIKFAAGLDGRRETSFAPVDTRA